MRVIVISVDGLANFYWNDPKAKMPALRRLAAEGAVARHGPGFMFVNDALDDETGPTRRYRGAHGHRATHRDNHAVFVAAGPGITRGTELDQIRHIDVAPTLAHLLGLRMPNVEGRVLTELLT